MSRTDPVPTHDAPLLNHLEGNTVAVVLDPQLLEILACPCAEHAPLAVGTPSDPMADALTCTSCGLSFPVVDGIPVLLLDDAFRDTPPEEPSAS